MEASTKKKVWTSIGVVALILIIVWGYKKFFAKGSNTNLPKESSNSGISYKNMIPLSSETITTVKPENKQCASSAGACIGGTLLLTGSDSDGCHYGCYGVRKQKPLQ